MQAVDGHVLSSGYCCGQREVENTRLLVPHVLSILCAETRSCAFQLQLPETPWREVAGELDSPLNTASNQA